MDAWAALPVALVITWGYRRLHARHPRAATRALAGVALAALAFVTQAMLRSEPPPRGRVWVKRATVDAVFPVGDRHVVRLAVAEPAVCLEGDARGVQALLDPGLDASGLVRGRRIDALIRVAPWGCGLVRFEPQR